MFVGLLQVILCPLLFGWIWSIWWGFGACKGGNVREAETTNRSVPEPAQQA